ncbi:LysM peptidoglycan-binding domain-containing protein [Desulfovibrio sulfodismutans]|uniref:LysM peptidoglycan-binding domain-containing protein n=1 Tax=Desulfolutivibrio sulfodismutans TaxID=63561 RepID=A0A7K3NKY1_9BACT|nr:LysM peptidoglycan-binding domain-containing protein [Desulfolutivibrio sulfodismutans]NDY56425.1 LysM peptidoglycan-binding domain-containing protein [Desulfolutivibrio sulfodismutans]QLA13814.1 LysM peptidoglycan-binding domain-containing protein [Desulfolutivibrio sulfodismutans DSM 3696]
MANSPKFLAFCLIAVLATTMAGCAKYSDYQANMAYINDDLLNQEGELALEQLRAARADYAQAVRSGPVAPGAEVEKQFFAAREKYIVIKKEKELRMGRQSSTKDLASDPELVIPEPPSGNTKRPAHSPAEIPAETPDSAPKPTTDADVPGPPGQALEKAAPAQAPSGSAEAAYTVQKGDTLGGIAKRHNVEVATLASHNALASQNRITPGQVLHIPPR